MNVSMTPEMEAFIQKLVESGRYVTASEVVREAVRLLMDEEHLREHNLEELREKIQAGLDSLEAGRKVVLNRELIEDVKARGRARAAAKKRQVA